MNLTHLFTSPILTRVHILLAVCAMALGLFQFLSKKGTGQHKNLGWVWVCLMAGVGISAVFLPERVQGTLPLTLLLTLWIAIGLPMAIIAIKRGNILLHRAFMMGLYIGGLAIAAAFTLTPGRLLYKVLIGG
ncbi:MAG: hypothetical protein FD128_42 [Hyphomonadaceae bacterium]|nr:MAG: hypothetical protein FD128_42 [Hyphomonadaceae bacterium]